MFPGGQKCRENTSLEQTHEIGAVSLWLFWKMLLLLGPDAVQNLDPLLRASHPWLSVQYLASWAHTAALCQQRGQKGEMLSSFFMHPPWPLLTPPVIHTTCFG